MRKALLLLTLAMLLPVAMSAQLLGTGNIELQRAPYSLKGFKPHSTRLMAPSRVDLGDNQMILGHYDSDALSTDGLGITGLPGTVTLGTILTADELAPFQGGKIVKFRVGLAAATTVSRVFVIPVSASGTIGTATQWTCSVNAAGWNEIELATPYEINTGQGEGLMIGFDYRQTSSNYPISAVMEGDIHTTYLYYQNSWQDVGLADYGNLSVQCIVESEFFPEYLIGVSELFIPSYVKLGEDTYFLYSSRNLGVAGNVPAGSVAYDVLIDGEVVSTMTNSRDLTRSAQDFEGSLSTTGLAVGKHTLTIRVNSLNGEPVETPLSASITFTVYENGFAHQMHLLEQFTSTYCTWCPLGIGMIQKLMELRDDIAWVGIHGNMSGTDPMRTLQCDSIMLYQGSNSYPSGSFDRSVGWDSQTAIVTGLGFYEEYHSEVAAELSSFYDYLAEAPAFATVNINSTYDADTREAVITVSGDLTPDFDQMLGADSKLTVYITEDGIVARQLNQGTWVSDFVHNGVMRRALPSVFGGNLNRNGDTYENVYTYTIPASWKPENLNVVAFISRPLANGATGVYTDMFVNQVNKRKLGEYDEPETLRGDVNLDGSVNISDVTDLIDYLLAGGEIPASADVDLDNSVNISDVTTLIDYLLSGVWND